MKKLTDIVDEDMCGELEEPIMVKMDVDKEGPKEYDKKVNKERKKGKGVKCKHWESAHKKKKENSKKAYKRSVQTYKQKWKEQKA